MNALLRDRQRRGPLPGRPHNSERGSVLLVALLLSTIIGLGLTSYLRLATTSLNTANRSFYTTAALELAQCGVEEAMASLYRITKDDPVEVAWAGWKRSGGQATRSFHGFKPGPNVEASIHVVVKDFAIVAQPTIVSKAVITPPGGAPIEQFLEVKARLRGLFSRGLVARDTLKCTSAAYFDSWDSDPDRSPSTPPVQYSSAVARANASLACGSLLDEAVKLKTSTVYGTVSTGGGIISHTDAVVSGTVGGTGVDLNRLHYDFAAHFPAVSMPVISASSWNWITVKPPAGTHFPRPGDKRAADQKYYYQFAARVALEVDKSTVTYVDDHCVFVFQNHTGADSIVNKGDLQIKLGASLVVYTNGHISAEGGRGFINSNNAPSACIIYGIDPQPGRQKVTIGGILGGGMACYMPNADLTLHGLGSMCGAFIGYRIDLKGSNAEFHFDEALARLGTGQGASVAEWRHLNSATDRALYASEFNF